MQITIHDIIKEEEMKELNEIEVIDHQEIKPDDKV